MRENISFHFTVQFSRSNNNAVQIIKKPVLIPINLTVESNLGAVGAVKSLMEEYVKLVTIYIARFVEIGAAVIIGFASIKALYHYLLGIFRPGGTFPKTEIRLSLGRTLALSLEFLLGADILQTAVAPTWDDIGKLAAIAILRTGLNFFLDRELKEADHNKGKEPELEPDIVKNKL